MLPYVASKFALVGFSEGLHAELRHKGVRVTTVCPGLMRTGGEAHAELHRPDQKRAALVHPRRHEPPSSPPPSSYAANSIYNAVAAGRAEITITPQAWLAARFAGLAPDTTQYLASLANQLLLPATLHRRPGQTVGFTLKIATYSDDKSPDATEDETSSSTDTVQPD